MRFRGIPLASALALLACAWGGFDPSLMANKRRSQVLEAAEAYGGSLRWGRIQVAAGWVAPAMRQQFLQLIQEGKVQIRFTGYEIEGIELRDERERVDALVSFQLYRLPSLQEATIRERQIWRYDRGVKHWYIEPDLALYRGDVGSEVGP